MLRAVEDFHENTPAHLHWLLEAVDMQDGRRNVVHTGSQPHEPEVILDPWPDGKKRTGNVVAIGKIVLGDDRGGLLMVHMCVWIFLLELTERLNAVVGDDE